MGKGPLIIYKEDDGISQAFRNLPGVELCAVSRLNLLQLAPGGHVGRFCVWSQAAIDKIDAIYGDDGKKIPAAPMINADIARIINSDEVQSVLNPAKRAPLNRLRKKNAIKSVKALAKLDPYAAAAREAETRAMTARAGKKAAGLKAKRAESKKFASQKKAFYASTSKQGDVCEKGFALE